MDKYNKEKSKSLLKERTDVRCSCKKKRPNNDRMKYGTCSCDGYSFCYTVGNVLANALLQYVADGSQRIVRDDWEIIEKHARSIKAFAEADSWDGLDKEPKIVLAYSKKEKDFKKALLWLSNNWNGLWW